MKLSIVTINYNNLEGLRDTINSVLSQTFHDYEWIIIDGGSTDGSKDLIEQNKQYLSYWCSESDKGIYIALNKGIAKANGEFISFMNSGDVYASENTLQDVFIRNHRGGVLYGDWVIEYNTKDIRMSFPIDKLYTEFTRRNICQQAMFYKTHLLKLNGFDETITILADHARNVELALSGVQYEYLPFVVCRYDMNGISSREDTTSIRKEDWERINMLYPKWLLPLLSELDAYRNRRCIQYTLEVVDGKSRLFSYITKAYLSITYMVCRLFHLL